MELGRAGPVRDLREDIPLKMSEPSPLKGTGETGGIGWEKKNQPKRKLPSMSIGPKELIPLKGVGKKSPGQILLKSQGHPP